MTKIVVRVLSKKASNISIVINKVRGMMMGLRGGERTVPYKNNDESRIVAGKNNAKIKIAVKNINK